MRPASTIERRSAPPWITLLSALACVALARALLVAARDGWWQAGLQAVALRSFARHAVDGALLAALPVLVLGLLFRRLRARPAPRARAALFLVAFTLGALFVSCRLPELPYQQPGFMSAAGWAGNAAAVAGALVAVLLLVARPRASPLPSAAGSVALLLLAAVLALRLAPGWFGLAGRARPGRPSVILISLDTVRADRLGCYGYGRDTTPAIDRFARQAMRFERAYSPQPWTLPAHMSMLTGLGPSAHGVDHENALPSGARTLAQLLAAQGWVTAAQVDRTKWLDERFGFSRGFHTYRRLGRTADYRIACVRDLLADLTDEPFFLFLHFYDAHSDTDRLPYESAPEDRAALAGAYRGAFTGCDERGRCATEFLQGLNADGRSLGEEERRHLSDLYDAGLRTLDRALARLFALLEPDGWLEQSIVILTADHGEEFFEHGLALHVQLYEECVHVPLLVRVPGLAPGSTDAFASLVDLAPTILELCGLEPPAEMQGRSLARILAGDMTSAASTWCSTGAETSSECSPQRGRPHPSCATHAQTSCTSSTWARTPPSSAVSP